MRRATRIANRANRANRIRSMQALVVLLLSTVGNLPDVNFFPDLTVGGSGNTRASNLDSRAIKTFVKKDADPKESNDHV